MILELEEECGVSHNTFDYCDILCIIWLVVHSVCEYLWVCGLQKAQGNLFGTYPIRSKRIPTNSIRGNPSSEDPIFTYLDAAQVTRFFNLNNNCIFVLLPHFFENNAV